MIFLTVGTQLGFDRLVQAVDTWARVRGREDVVAQIGETRFQPKVLQSRRFMSPIEFDAACGEAELIVAHAGTGSILTALRHKKPIVVMPRLARLGEHRNDHQVATAEHFASMLGVRVAFDEAQLVSILDDRDALSVGAAIDPVANIRLTEAIGDFIGQVCDRGRR